MVRDGERFRIHTYEPKNAHVGHRIIDSFAFHTGNYKRGRYFKFCSVCLYCANTWDPAAVSLSNRLISALRQYFEGQFLAKAFFLIQKWILI